MLAGLFAAAIGFFLILIALGVVFPSISMKSEERWLGAIAGAAFLFAGLTVILQAAAAKPDTLEGELPPDAPIWIRLLNYFFILMIIAMLATVASWVAFGPGDRAFSGPAWFLPSWVNEVVGRVVFGAGAIITWLILIVVAVVAMRRLRNQK